MSIANAASMPLLEPITRLNPPVAHFMNPRLAPIVLAVVCAHGLALWGLQAAFRRTEPQAETPIVMVASLVNPDQAVVPSPPPPAPPAPPPKTPATPPAPPKAPAPAPIPVKPRAEPAPKPVIEREAVAPEPASRPEAMALENLPSAPVPETTAVQSSAPAVSAPAAPPAPPPLELPSSTAKHLNNPKPPYPALSKRMGEQGTVVIRALIGTDGFASEVTVHASSGYPRLDRSALQAVRSWRFVPGKRAGVPEAMSFDIPLTFELAR